MKIQSQTLKSLESKLQKGSGKAESGIAKGMEIRATVVDASINKVRIMLENGRELSAKSSVPFENFINEKLIFKVLSDDGGFVIRPKLQESNIRHELDMKISKLLASLGLHDSHESREIMRDMMKLEIPVTKSNFLAVSENIRSLEILKALGEDEVSKLAAAVDKAGGMELRELGKLVIAQGKGENLKDLIDNLKAAAAGRDELLFMFKNGIKLNAQNILNMSCLSEGSENIATVLDRLADALNALPAEPAEITDAGWQSGKTTNEMLQAKIKNELATIADDMLVDFANEGTAKISKKGGLEVLSGKLDELIQATADKGVQSGLDDISSKLQLMSELGKSEGYFQIPLKGHTENHVAQLLVKRERKKEPGENYTALIAIGTSNLGNVACKISYSSNYGYDVEFSLENERVVGLFKSNARAIDQSLSELGSNAVRTKFRLSAESERSPELIGAQRDTIQEIPNFDMWV